MRKRKSILIVALIMTLGGFSLYHGWSFFRANEMLRTYFVEKLRPVLSEDFNIQQLNVSLGAVHLKNVFIHLEKVTIRISDVRIGYSITGLIRHGFKPAYIANDILLNRPRVQLKLTSILKKSVSDSSIVVNDTADSAAFFPFKIFKKELQAFDFIQRVTISRGLLFLTDSLNREIPVAGDIEGWINSSDPELAVAEVQGKLFSSANRNFSMNARYNLEARKDFQLDFQFDHFKLSNSPPALLPAFLKLSKGLLHGHVTYYGDASEDLTGEFHILDAEIHLNSPPVTIDSLNLKFGLKGRDLIINNAFGFFEASKINLAGSIENLPAPRFDLLFYADQLNLQDCRKLFTPFPEIQPSGMSSFRLAILDSLSNPTIRGILRADSFTVNTIPDNRFSLQFLYQNSKFSISQLEGELFHSSMTGRGSVLVDSVKPVIDLQFHFHGKIDALLSRFGTIELRKSDYDLNFNVSGTLEKPEVHGSIRTHLMNRYKQKIFWENQITYRSGKFEIKSDQNLNEDFRIAAELSLVEPQPVFKIDLNNLQHFLDLLYPDLPFRLLNYTSHLRIQGNLSKYAVYAEILRKNESRLLMLLSEVAHQDTIADITGEMIFNPDCGQRLKSNFHIMRLRDSYYIDSLSVNNFLKITGRFGQSRTQEIKADIKFNKAPLQAFVGVFFPNFSDDYQGNIWGQVHINGLLLNPHINGYLALNNGQFNQVGEYESEFSFNFENDVLLLEDFSVVNNKKTITSGRGFYNHRTKNVNFRFNSRFFDSHDLLKSFGIKRDFLKGHGAFDFKLSRSLYNPKIDGQLSIYNGEIYHVKFDTLKCLLGAGIIENAPWKNKDHDSSLVIQQMTLKRRDDFQIFANGFIPFAKNKEMNISINGAGNFLAILPDWDSYFLETASKGQLELTFAGRPDAPKISKGQFELREGFLRVESIFDKIDDIRCKIMLKPERKFLHLAELSAIIRGELLRVSNVEYAYILGRAPLEPFFLHDWGLNLGILKVRTSAKGVQVNIPGLMEKGELGRIQLAGLTPNESAWLAGPWRRPVVRAKTLLRNLRFTYPFIETGMDSLSTAARVLASIEWDLELKLIKDTRYVRKITGAPDAVYVNLLLNEGSEGIRLRGRGVDESLMLEGTVESNRGFVEYLDFNFRVEQAGARFDRTSIFPIVYGSARATMVDSTGFTNYLHLTLYTIDPITHEKRKMGRWDRPNLYFELTSDNVNLGGSDGEILTNLGYSFKNLRAKVPDIIGISADNWLLKPIFRPFERTMERMFRLDYVQFRSRIARNLVEKEMSGREYDFSRYSLLRNSRVTLGKYLADRWFFLYTGELKSPMSYQPSMPSIGLRHTLGLEYQIRPNLLIEMEYDYNSLLLKNKEDKKIMLRHSFPF